MKKRLLMLGVPAFFAPVAIAAAPPLAPPVARPAATTPSAAPAHCGRTPATPCPPRSSNPQDYYVALTAGAAAPGSDPLLDKGVLTAMSRLLAADRCSDAVTLATQNGRPDLAARAKQLCQVR